MGLGRLRSDGFCDIGGRGRKSTEGSAATAGADNTGAARFGREYVGSVAVVTGELESRSMSMSRELKST